MAVTLQKRIHTLVHAVLGGYPGAWMVWCDPRGDWLALLRRVANDTRLGGFSLVEVEERTGREIGGPASRRDLQARLDAGEGFVLYVPAGPESLGWMWAHALLAEQIYAQTLRAQLMEWGWKPHSLHTTDEEIATMAVRGLQQDPAQWGGSGLQPDIALLLETLATGAVPGQEERLVFDLTVEQAGLPPFSEDDALRWRRGALARLLVTQAHASAPKLVGDSHELLVGGGQRPFALEVLEKWRDSLRLSRGLPEMIVETDRLLRLSSVAPDASIKHGPFLLHSAERAAFVNTCKRLAGSNGKGLLETLAGMRDEIARHAEGFWGAGVVMSHPQAVPWGELLRLGEAAAALLEASPTTPWANPAEAVEWYVSGGWRVDQAGEQFLRNLLSPVPELLELIMPLRAAYRARWESLMIAWTQVWEGAGCPMPDPGSAGEWLIGVLAHKGPIAVLVADALRYDLANALATRINRNEGIERAVVRPARAPLPSITPLGMAMALPVSERDLAADVVDGKWQVRYKDDAANLAIAQHRREWWHAHGRVAPESICGVPQILSEPVPPPDGKRTRLVIYDDAIDKLGHDDELEAEGSDAVLDRYARAIERLHGAGWQRVAVLTDHGYIHWADSQERSMAFPAPGPLYSSRRAAAYSPDVKLGGPQALAPGGRVRVAVPRGAASFRAYGGLGYFHGGASLQEWIVPCVLIEWPSQSHPVRVALQPLDKLLSERPTVTLRVSRDRLLLQDMVARQVDLVIRNAEDRTLLFRSEPVLVTPDREEITVTLNATEGVEAPRGTPVQIEVRDTRTDEVLDSRASTLMIELTGW